MTDQDGDLTPTEQNAVALHEMFLAFQAGGFTELQALQLVVMYDVAINGVPQAGEPQ